MKAVVYTQYGSPDNLRLREIPLPVVRDNEVLIRVHAASVNSWDWDLVTGRPLLYRLLFGLLKPRYPVIGSDIAGVVESVGNKVRRFKPGDKVLGDISAHGFGAFAEFATATEELLTIKPETLTFNEAAAIPQAGLLALQALRYKGTIKAGQKVLINAAGGGVGSFAIQLAKKMDAEVHAVDRTDKVDFMKSLGADEVFDYTTNDITNSGHTYDHVLDNMAQRPFSDFRKILKPGGRYVMTGGGVAKIMRVGLFGRFERDRTACLLPLQVNSQDLQELAELVESRSLRVAIDKIYSLDHTAEAIRWLGEAKVKGKVVIAIR